ncbi:MAG: OmpA family protein [Prevotellaceae bacterium]|nr:OmpA family protein [Candidatus Colivivens equi]
MKHIFSKEKGEDHDFWMSYTDLMSGFLVIFIIATVVYYMDNKEYIDAFKDIPKNERKERVEKIKASGNMVNINKDFSDVFVGVDGIEIMPDSVGSIRFYPSNGADQMFKINKDSMLPNLETRINKIGKKFVRQAIDLKKAGKNILEIRIEGHTDTDGTFLHNMSLSSDRAYAVYEHIYNKCGLNEEERSFVKNYMISVGYSYAKTVKDEFGKENKDKSRRIEFKIITK